MVWLHWLWRGTAVMALVALLWTQGGAQEQEEQAEYIGDEFCLGCHREYVGSEWAQKRHNRQLLSSRLLPRAEERGCEGCHGPGSLHVADADNKRIVNPREASPRESARSCLRCHQSQIAAARWLATAHAQEKVPCSGCHDAHATTKEDRLLRKGQIDLCLDCHQEIKATLRMNSHHPVLEGRLVCTSCHDVHEQRGDGKLLKRSEDLCVTCHSEKRGPFMFEHETAPGGGTEKCLQCHRVHGSPNLKLLEFGGRGLCLQCHTNQVNHRPGPDCWSAGCHTRIHGSNRNLLFLF